MQNLLENTCTGVSFNKIVRPQCGNLLKTRHRQSVFLWILWNVLLQSNYRTIVHYHFWTVILFPLFAHHYARLMLTHFSPVSHFYTLWKRQETKGLKWANYMKLFYAMIHVMHPIHWLKLKKTLRKTSVLAYLNCDLLKYKGVCILHYIQNTEDRKCPHFWNYPKLFSKITCQSKTIFYQFFWNRTVLGILKYSQKSVCLSELWWSYKLLCASESYWEHCQLSKMRLLAKLVNG